MLEFFNKSNQCILNIPVVLFLVNLLYKHCAQKLGDIAKWNNSIRKANDKSKKVV